MGGPDTHHAMTAMLIRAAGRGFGFKGESPPDLVIKEFAGNVGRPQIPHVIELVLLGGLQVGGCCHARRQVLGHDAAETSNWILISQSLEAQSAASRLVTYRTRPVFVGGEVMRMRYSPNPNPNPNPNWLCE